MTERIMGMFVVMDYADKVCPDFTFAHVKTANYRQEDSIFMGPWKPLMERRGFPETEGRNALDLLYDKIKMAGEKVDYVCLGQMTTLGCLMFTHPDAAKRIRRIVICPGEQNRHRDYPVSEEHILSDPVAARIVMNADVTKFIMAEETSTAQYESLERYMSAEASSDAASMDMAHAGAASMDMAHAGASPVDTDSPSVYATVILDMGCTYGSFYIDRLDICKKKPNTVLIGGYYDGKNPGNH